MLFSFKAVDQSGKPKEGTVDAHSEDAAISSLQRKGLIISSIQPAEDEGGSFGSLNITLFESVSNKDVVLMSRQIATLFEAQVSALRVFRLIAAEVESPLLQRTLTEVADDLQGGSAISKALGKHPKVFSKFFVNMVRAGEEAGKLDETFNFLAEYLDRTYEITTKARNALIYPGFIITTFVVVMALMLTMVIPRISEILLESGQDVPIYTKAVLSLSGFLVNYGVFFLILIVIGGFFGWRFVQTGAGRLAFDEFKLSVPFIGSLYKKLYLSRIADNLDTMLSSGIAVVQALEITSSVVGNAVYENILTEATNQVKGGAALSDAFGEYRDDIPGIMIAMIRVGEETGELGSILKTLANFYRREVNNAIDTLVTLIEPFMIVALALGVGVLLASVLIPIYNISSSI